MKELYYRWKKRPRIYHAHALEGYQKCMYTYLGSFCTKKAAIRKCRSFLSSYPYGTATVTNSPEIPEYKH